MNPIEIQGLTVEYKQKGRKPRFRAVDNLSLQIGLGEVVGFIGPNGAGKSTTLKSLMGFIFPRSGRMTVLGHPAGSVEAKRGIGYLPEVAQYYPFMKPAEVLFLYGSAQKLDPDNLRQRIPILLEKVGLKGREDRLLKKCSKGMLQRVGIAQALMGDPQLLILDEVTSGLDPVGRRDIRNLLLERKNSGATIFFSSHELTEVARLCDRIILIDEGRILEEHRLEDLLDRLQTYRIVFRNGNGNMPADIDYRELSEGLFETEAHDLKTYLRIMEGLLTAPGIEVVDSETTRGSLEEYFVRAIGGKVT